MAEQAEKQIRLVESEVLDLHYRRFALMYRDPDLAKLLLADCWSALLDFIDKRRDLDGNIRSRSIFQISLRGLGHCLRWVSRREGEILALPRANDEELRREASDFLNWGIAYEKLTIDHIAWSRGILSSEIDAERRIIRFRYPADFDSFYLLTQQSSVPNLVDQRFARYPDDLISSAFTEWASQPVEQIISFQIGRDIPVVVEAARALRHWVRSQVMPELPPDTDLGGFSLNEFCIMWAHVHLLAEFWTRLVDAGPGRDVDADESHGSVLIYDHRALVRAIAVSCDIPEYIVRNLLNDLTFNTKRNGTTLIEQPFILHGKREIMMMPRLLAYGTAFEMLSRLLTRTQKARIYSRISPALEKHALDIISESLRKRGWEVLREYRLAIDPDKELTPDLIILDHARGHLLVIEYKHALVPGGPSELASKLEELDRWVSRLREYQSAVATWVGDGTLAGSQIIGSLLLFRWPMPLPSRREPDVTLADWVSLRTWLDLNPHGNLADLVTWARTRQDVSGHLQRVRLHEEDIAVGDWVYSRSFLAG